MTKGQLASARAWRSRNPERVRNMALMYHYGISLEEYNKMLSAQGGSCAICSCVPGLRRLAVDHNHSTGKVRGLLCGPCNRALGILSDDPALLRAASDYLERSKS
jgi:hypothetical protein